MVFLLLSLKTCILNMLPKRRQKKRQVYQETGNKRGMRTGKIKNRERAGLLSRYDFAFAGRDTVNQVVKIVPGIIKELPPPPTLYLGEI